HRIGHRGARAAAPVASRRRPDLPPLRDLHRGDDRLFPALLSHRARRRCALPPRGASGRLMNLDWSVLAPHADRFLDGALMTVFLTVATMALAIPGGLVLAFLRLSPWSPVRRVTTGFVEFFRATPLILQIYWAYYVLPAFFDIQFSELTTAIVGLTCNI